jgi:hypothetical protein
VYKHHTKQQKKKRYNIVMIKINNNNNNNNNNKSAGLHRNVPDVIPLEQHGGLVEVSRSQVLEVHCAKDGLQLIASD